MNREEFMKELEYLIQDIPDEDKTDALQYYRDYFDEAGEENEAGIIDEFGSPERIAAIIRADISGNLKDGGEFTDNGYQDERFRDPNYQMAKRYDLPDVKEGQESSNTGSSHGTGVGNTQPRTSKVLKIILIVILLIMASPVIFGVGGGIVGIVAGLAGVLVAMIAVIGALTIAFLIAGVALFFSGIVTVLVSPLNGMLIIGLGVLFLGVGFLFLIIAILFYGKFIPFLFRSIVDGLNKLFHRGGRYTA